jgi:N-formylglutamate amidohydrolase
MPINKLPIAIILPHASLAVPSELEERLALTEADIFNEADVYTDLLFDFRDRVAQWHCFPYARGIIDVNRPEDPRLLKRAGDGVVKELTSYGRAVYKPGMRPTPEEEAALIDRYWRPWHAMLEEIASDPNIKLVIDGHSMAARGPNKYDPHEKLRPRACASNLGDARGAPRPGLPGTTMAAETLTFLARAIARNFETLPALCPEATPGPVQLNAPYAGGWDLKAHGINSQQPWAMIEVSRALYIGPQLANSPVQPPQPQQIGDLQEALWEAILALYHHLQQ